MAATTGSSVRARALRRAAVVGSSAAAAVLLLAVPALAHITITPDSVPAGSAAVLTFHVPNEEAHADTTRVDMQIPTTHPIAQLLVKPVPGWTSSVRAITLGKPIVTDDGQFTQAVSEVIWSGGRILPGQFQDFTVSADPLPAGVSQLAFKAIQTYSNGDVVRWIDLPQPGQPAPDHPAPVLKLTTAAATATAPVATTAAAAGGAGSDGTARALGVAGLLAGLLALVVAGWRRRRPAPAGGRAGAPAGGGAGAPARADRGGMPADEQAMAAEPAGTKAAKPRTAEPAGTKAAKPRTPEPAGTNGAKPRSQPRRRR